MEYKILAHMLSHSTRKEYEELIRTSEWKCSEYSKRRMEERGLQLEDVAKAIDTGKLIEYSRVQEQDRVLLRDENGVCVVLSLEDYYQSTIVTAFRNAPTDNHSTLNKDNYLLM